MERYLIFNEQGTAGSVGDGLHDTACWPLSRFLGFTNLDSTATKVSALFRSLSEPDNPASADRVDFTITENKHMDAMKAIVRQINAHPNSDGAIVVFDAAAGISPSSLITGIAVIVRDASN
jgi:hypothetical protein